MRGFAVVLCLLAGCARLLGLDDIHPAPGPDAPPIPGVWVSVAAGSNHTCGIQLDHSLWCFGDNAAGEAAVGMVEAATPTKIGSASWSAVSTLADHTCGLQLDGSLWCWGENSSGQVGTTSSVAQAFAPLPVASGTTWRAVSAGHGHTCAIRSDQTLWCWGDNTYGELATGDTTSSNVPVEIASDPGGWLAVAAAELHTCAVRQDGSLWCWGYNLDGQTGLGQGLPQTMLPAQVGTATDWTAVVAGETFTCGLRGDQAYCWGDNYAGQLGDGTFTRQFTPVPVAATGSWTSLTAGVQNTCGVKSDGTAWCWGSSQTGQLAQDMDAGTPVQMAGSWTAIATGGGHTCAIDSVSGLWCVGLDGAGQLGDGSGGGVAMPELIDATGWTSVSVGTEDSCGLRNGALMCWGLDEFAELGDGDAKPNQAPLQIAASGVTALAITYSHSCRLVGTALYCVGDNRYGNFGNNSTTSSVTPVKVTSPSMWSAVAVGAWLTCGIDNTNALYCWGEDNVGQVGNGTTATNVAAPVMIGSNYSAVGAGYTYGCGLTSGNAMCWGTGGAGELGLGVVGSGDAATAPTAVVGGHTFSALAVGFFHACAIESGVVWCWGSGQYGMLGNGDTLSSGTPVSAGGTTWTAVTAGWYHTCGLQSDGSLWCWGYNGRGQLGDGTRSDRSTPVQIGAGMTWTSVSAGAYHTCATASTGALYCWGTRFFGELGDGQAWRTTMVRAP